MVQNSRKGNIIMIMCRDICLQKDEKVLKCLKRGCDKVEKSLFFYIFASKIIRI